MAASLRVPTITVESDRHFARSVMRRLPPDAEETMIVANIGITREWGVPLFTSLTKRRQAAWYSYVSLPFAGMLAEDPFPDLVLVDGRFRRACALESARQAQLRGAETTIFVDDYEGRSYGELAYYLGNPVMAGRAAVFAIGKETRLIDDAVVRSAAQDFG